MSDEDRDELLKLLEAQGRQFLQNFSLPASFPGASASTSDVSNGKAPEESEEEWGGIEQSSDSDIDLEEESLPGSSHRLFQRSGNSEESDFEHEDDDFVAGSSSTPPVVVFAHSPLKPKDQTSHVDKALMKSFMSSKIARHRGEPTASSKKRRADESDEEERTNAQHDAMLHKLVHTKLLSGSLDPELDMTGAERRKALAGRIRELTGEVKLGKGENVVRAEEHRRASKRVREGLAEKKKERQMQQLEEAQNLGNYHPALKKLFEGTSKAPSRTRARGLKMGVGKFKNGSLMLRKEDVQKIQGGPHPSRKTSGKPR